jgi:hypothetical protein
MINQFIFFSCCFFFSFQLQALEIKRVIVSTNNDSTYIDFWPVVANLWQKAGFIPTLALIAEDDVEVDTSIGEVIRFRPIPGVPESLHAQSIRLLLPVLFPDDGCLISDIDMLPISREYYKSGAALSPDDAFLIYKDKAYAHNELKYPMCYFAARGDIFQKVFKVNTYDEIGARITEWAAEGHGWVTDETVLYREVCNWEKNEQGLIHRLGNGVGPRIDRLYWNLENLDALVASGVIDCHCPRPYSINKEAIDRVCSAILNYWHQQDETLEESQ